MSYDYHGFYNLSRRLIDKFGAPVTLGRLSDESIDPDKPWNGNVEPELIETLEATGVYVPAASVNGTEFGRYYTSDLLQRLRNFLLVSPIENEDLSRFNIVVEENSNSFVLRCDVLKPTNLALLYYFGISI